MTDVLGPATQDLDVYQGSDHIIVLQLWQDAERTMKLDLTGMTFNMQIREAVKASGASVLMALTSAETGDGSGRIRVICRNSADEPEPYGEAVPTDGVIALDFAAEVTAAITLPKAVRRNPGTKVVPLTYDLEMVDADGHTERIMRGLVKFDLEVTGGA